MNIWAVFHSFEAHYQLELHELFRKHTECFMTLPGASISHARPCFSICCRESRRDVESKLSICARKLSLSSFFLCVWASLDLHLRKIKAGCFIHMWRPVITDSGVEEEESDSLIFGTSFTVNLSLHTVLCTNVQAFEIDGQVSFHAVMKRTVPVNSLQCSH